MAQTTDTIHLLRALSNQMADAVEHVTPSLVIVNGRQRQPASGLIYGPDLVLTADHVLEREEDLTIQTHDNRTLPAQFVGRDLGTDLALLRVANLGLAPAQASEESVRVGQLVLAVGRTPSDGPMASTGVVSTIGGPLRTGRGTILERYIRTDQRADARETGLSQAPPPGHQQPAREAARGRARRTQAGQRTDHCTGR